MRTHSQAANLQNSDTFYKTQVFPDVNSSTAYYKAIQWAYHNKIISGSNGKFNPNGKLTEAQFAKMFAEFFQLPALAQQSSSERLDKKLTILDLNLIMSL